MSACSITSIVKSVPEVDVVRAGAPRRESAGVAGDPSVVIDARASDVAMACHELRNSLSVILNAAGLLRLPASRGALDTARSLIERHVEQMNRHIGDLLEPAGHARDAEALRLARLDLRIVVRDAVDALRPELARRGHRLALRLPGAPVWVHADGSRLEQVFSNLLINAAKYTPDDGDIALTMGHDSQQVRVIIRDSGIGIADAMLSQVFEMFVRVAPVHQGGASGDGIGLAVVRNLVAMHGGTVKATSPGLGFGSAFTVVLPAMGPQR